MSMRLVSVGRMGRQRSVRPWTSADCPHCDDGPHDTYVNGNNARCPVTGRPYYVPRWQVPGDTLDDRPHRRVTCRRGHTFATRAKLGGRTSCPECGLDVYVRRDAPVVVATPPPRRRGPLPRPRGPELLDDWLDRIGADADGPDDDEPDDDEPDDDEPDDEPALSVAAMLSRWIVQSYVGRTTAAHPSAHQRTGPLRLRTTPQRPPQRLRTTPQRPPQRRPTRGRSSSSSDRGVVAGWLYRLDAPPGLCAFARHDRATDSWVWCTTTAEAGTEPESGRPICIGHADIVHKQRAIYRSQPPPSAPWAT